MASPQQFNDPPVGEHPDFAPPVLRLRLVPWDVLCTLVLLATLLVAAIATDWWAQLFGFLKDVCTGEDCPPVPYGVDFYIYPLVWGGIGAAIALVVLSSVVGSILTTFCGQYWH